MRGALDAGALRRALDRIVVRHEVLRTTFAVVEGEPVQRIQPVEQARFELREEDLRERGETGEELARRIEEEAEACFRSGERATDSGTVAAGGRGRAHSSDHHAPHRFR